MKFYIAGPFFNDNQIKIIEQIKSILKNLEEKFYSPKDDGLYTPGGKITPLECFESNINEIKSSDAIIAITDGLDAGTMFECGAAYILGKPICYLWIDHKNKKFNLMLSESSSAICYNFFDLVEAIVDFRETKKWPEVKIKGEIE